MNYDPNPATIIYLTGTSVSNGFNLSGVFDASLFPGQGNYINWAGMYTTWTN